MATDPATFGEYILRTSGRTADEITQESDRVLDLLGAEFDARGWTIPQLGMVLCRTLVVLTLADPDHPHKVKQVEWFRGMLEMWRIALTSGRK